jgi:hypothetical protein
MFITAPGITSTPIRPSGVLRPSPKGQGAHPTGNEMTSPDDLAPQLKAEYGYWPQGLRQSPRCGSPAATCTPPRSCLAGSGTSNGGEGLHWW